MAAAYDFASHPANENYEQRVEAWLAMAAEIGSPATLDEINQLLDDGMSVAQVMRAADVSEQQVRAVKRARDQRATPGPQARRVWETGW